MADPALAPPRTGPLAARTEALVHRVALSASSLLLRGVQLDELLEPVNRQLEEVGLRLIEMTIDEPRSSHVPSGPAPAGPQAMISAPMMFGRRRLGALRATALAPLPRARAALTLLAADLATVLTDMRFFLSSQEAAAERRLKGEFQQAAYQLHDGPGQVMVAIRLLAGRFSEDLPTDSPWRARFARLASLAGEAKVGLDSEVRGLAFTPDLGQGLVPALHRLAAVIEQDSGIGIMVAGDEPALSPAEQRALYRVAHQAIINAWRHARCAAIRIRLAQERDRVSLEVGDDGVGIRRRGGSPMGFGFASMRRTVEELDGTLEVHHAQPHGVVVTARIPRKSDMISVLLLDDHPVVREGLGAILDKEPDFRIVDQVGTAADASRALALGDADVLVADLRLPDLSGIELIRKVRKTHPRVKILALTSFPDDRSMVDALSAGAAGFLIKEAEPSLLREAIRAVAGGGTFIDPHLAAHLVTLATRAREPKGPFGLTRQELLILDFLPAGASNREIATEVGLSEHTVKSHVRAILRKLGAKGRAEASALATREGLI